MSVQGALGTAVFAVLAVLATRNLPGFWRQPATKVPAWPTWWARSLPVAVALGWAMLAALPLAVVTPHQHGGVQRVLIVLLTLALLVVVILGAIWITVALFGRPSRVVPPAYRR